MEKKKRKSFALQTMRIYLGEAGKYPWTLLGSFIGIIALQGGMLGAPLYLRQFFNALSTSTPSDASFAVLVSILIVVAGFYVLEWVARRLFTFTLIHLDSRIMARLYERAFDNLVRHSHHFFANQFAGTLTRRVSKFSNAFETISDAILIQFIPTGLFISGAVVILYLHNQVLGLMLGIWVVLFVCIQMFFVKMQQSIRAKRAEKDSRMVGALADAISNQSTITLFAGVSFETKRFSEAVQSWRRALARVWFADEIVWLVLGFLMIVIEIGLLYGALHFWRLGLVTIGDFALIQAYLLTTFDRLVVINRELRRFNEAFADAGEMVEILETPLGIKDAPNAKPIGVSQGHIEFKNVGFRFSEGRPLLSDFNLNVKAKEKVALVGPSGAGKSTVTKLLLRLFDVQDGGIFIDGQNISHATQASVRESVSLVPQEPILFHRTLMENIRYGKRDATDAEVIAAAKQAHCYDFIMNTPQGFETFVGERGVRLSGGERQRVAIARAILKNAPILVLDEATSSLDSESEALIQDALAKLMQGKTVIAIAHRLSTVMKMDRIIVIEKGKVVTSGTHDELVNHDGGLYKKLWEIQAGGFLVDEDESDVIREKERE